MRRNVVTLKKKTVCTIRKSMYVRMFVRMEKNHRSKSHSSFLLRVLKKLRLSTELDKAFFSMFFSFILLHFISLHFISFCFDCNCYFFPVQFIIFPFKSCIKGVKIGKKNFYSSSLLTPSKCMLPCLFSSLRFDTLWLCLVFVFSLSPHF